MKLERTITTIFIVPTLGIDREELKNNGFVNGYIKDGQRDVQYNNAVYLLFLPKNLIKFKKFLDELYERSDSLVIDDYDYAKDHIVIVCNLNKKWKRDYDLVMKGEYSKTSFLFQESIPKVVMILKNGLHRDEMSLQHKIFRKSEDLRKYWEEELNISLPKNVEYWEGWTEERETLTENKV